MSTTHIIVYGASGRMGARLCALVAADPQLRLHAAVVRPGSPHLGQPAGAGDAPRYITHDAIPPGASIVMDFSSPEGAADAASVAQRDSLPLLIGATGLPDDAVTRLRDLSRRIPVLLAPNTSLGVAVLADAAARVAGLLGPAYRASIVEAHHDKKKDAPSGTAKRLAGAVRGAGGTLPDDQLLAIRAGDIIGEHTIRFAGHGEYLELSHRATSRDLFALGALRAAKWLAGKPAGWYSIEHALGINPT